MFVFNAAHGHFNAAIVDLLCEHEHLHVAHANLEVAHADLEVALADLNVADASFDFPDAQVLVDEAFFGPNETGAAFEI